MTIRACAITTALLAGAPLAAQEVTLPSGNRATLFDVVLEAATGPTAPDAFTDPDGEDGGAALSSSGEDLSDEEPAAVLPTGTPADETPADETPADETPADETPADTAQTAGMLGGLARFRLFVPGLGGAGAGFDEVASDFAWVCAELALPALGANGWAPTEVVVTLADRETAFGVLDAEALQFFEGFRISDGACVPQAF